MLGTTTKAVYTIKPNRIKLIASIKPPYVGLTIIIPMFKVLITNRKENHSKVLETGKKNTFV